MFIWIIQDKTMEALETGVQAPQEKLSTPLLEKRKYNVGGSNVEVNVARFNPEADKSKNRAVVYLMGLPWTAGDETTWAFPAQLAENLKMSCYSIDTTNSRVALSQQGKAIAQFLTDERVVEVTFVGHSMGAVKAAHTVNALQHDHPEVKIDGLVLIDPMGLSRRRTADIIKDLIMDAGKVAPNERKRGGVKAGESGPAIEAVSSAQFMKEFLGDLKKITKTDKLGIPLILSLRKAIISKDPIFSKLGNVPVWIIAGGKDKVSNYESYLSPDERAVLQPKSKQEEMFELARVRSELAKERHFNPETPVKVSVTKRQADHGGAVAVRGDQVSKLISRIPRIFKGIK